MKSDSQIQAEVMSELKWDPSLTHEHIGVSVQDGIVTLSGTIPSYMEKYAAEKAAQKVAGVKAVVEKIEVKLPGSSVRDDQDIANAVTQQFRWNIQVPDKDVKIQVENGWIELSGMVEWDFQRTAAESAARSTTGVRGVTNLITIKAKPIQTSVVKNRIEEALKREATREARRITVEIKGSKAILSGKVHSFSEVEEAKYAAWGAPGITAVESNLTVTQ